MAFCHFNVLQSDGLSNDPDFINWRSPRPQMSDLWWAKLALQIKSNIAMTYSMAHAAF